MAASETLSIGRRKVAVSNLDKQLYPCGFTKRDVIDYYLRISPVMLPHLRDRAVTLKRYPNGSKAMHFFEKNCPMHRPPWVQTRHVPGNKSEGVTHCVLNDRAALLWAANLAALELHVPMGKADNPQRPLAMVFDFDPGAPATLRDCAAMALCLRDMFAGLNLQTFAKTSGNKGLHVYVPLNSPCTFDDTKNFARSVTNLFERTFPNEVTSNMSKALRPGKVFIDWSQNDDFKTTVCAYSLRALECPGVSTPLSWEEVESCSRSKNGPDRLRFSPAQVLTRIEKFGDLFAPVLKLRQKLPSFDAV
jgi:bifunctional non-homologous end joining protein LigD